MLGSWNEFVFAEFHHKLSILNYFFAKKQDDGVQNSIKRTHLGFKFNYLCVIPKFFRFD